MKLTVFVIIFLFVCHINVNAQIIDSSLIKKLSINNFCLCNTTLSSIKQSNANLKEVNVEEMDNPPGCYGQDSRFIVGKGYQTDRYPGLLFQKDQNSDYISKIRLTKQFKGKLPDGNFIDLNQFKLKDLFKLYPRLKDKWGSRGCSDYWNFSNDTISFYVKIDKAKQPQFPIDEAYYSDKPVEGIDLIMSCYSVQKHNDVDPITKVNTDPVYFIDSIKVNKTVLMNFEPKDVASVSVYKDTSAVKIYGPEAKYGLIYIETKTFSKLRYWKYFKSKSEEYAKIVTSPGNDSNIQYILNKRVLKENFEGDLASINDKLFKGIQIITKDQLSKDYGIKNKDYGVIVSSDIPPNLYNGKSKF